MTPTVKILIVDDEISIRDNLALFLEDYNFWVSTAGNAEDAIGMIRKEEFDLCVVDLRLPKMSGELFIQEAHRENAALQFLIHTGSVGYRLPDELLQIGMQPADIFLKPLSDMTTVADRILQLFS